MITLLQLALALSISYPVSAEQNFCSSVYHAGLTVPKGNGPTRPKPRPLDCLKAQSDPFVCMSCNLFFEARGEGSLGMNMVAEITVNRFDKNSDRRNSICKVVHENAQFSWTSEKSATISELNQTELAAWNEAQAIANQYLMFKRADGNFSVPNPQFHCYGYYLSLRQYKKKSDLPPAQAQYYEQTIRGPDESKPICYASHLFIRDPAAACSPTVQTDIEGDDYVLMERNNFYRKCLGAAKMPPELRPDREQPDNQLCSKLGFEAAQRAQFERFRDPLDIMNMPIEQVPAGDAPALKE